MAHYRIVKKHEGGRTWRTVIVDTRRPYTADGGYRIAWASRTVGWTKATRAEAERMLPLLDPPAGLVNMLRLR
jgi:hypothetical protein